MASETWQSWLRACARDKASPAHDHLPGSLGMLTGQDSKALAAIDACWQLYAVASEGERVLIRMSVRELLCCMQPKCRPFAKELIARALDWDDRNPVWESTVTTTAAMASRFELRISLK